MRISVTSVKTLTIACSLFITTAGAVNLSTNNLGQLIIVPYYNVENGNETLFSVTNVTDRAKAVKIFIREAENAQPVLYFNLYLSAHDVWVGKIGATVDGGAKISVHDKSCTMPSFSADVNFRSHAYINDGGDTSIARTREGYIEIIEMGEIEADSEVETAVSHFNGEPNDCALVNSYWSPDGVWFSDSAISMEAPGGGLKGSASIINVLQGVEYSEPVTVMENFYMGLGTLHEHPGVPLPSIADAYPFQSVRLTQSGSPSPIISDDWVNGGDAVSAVLIKQELINDYVANPAVAAETDWLLTFPTKRLYTQSTIPTSPFTSVFTGSDGACESAGFISWDRAEQSGNSISTDICYASNVINFGASNVLHGLRTNIRLDPVSTVGWAQLSFSQTMSTPKGYTYTGLPVIGFAVTRLANSWVGTAAGYSIVTPHSSPALKGSQAFFCEEGLCDGLNQLPSSPGDDITYVSNEQISTQGKVTVSPKTTITFIAPIVILGKEFGVASGGNFIVKTGA